MAATHPLLWEQYWARLLIQAEAGSRLTLHPASLNKPKKAYKQTNLPTKTTQTTQENHNQETFVNLHSAQLQPTLQVPSFTHLSTSTSPLLHEHKSHTEGITINICTPGRYKTRTKQNRIFDLSGRSRSSSLFHPLHHPGRATKQHTHPYRIVFTPMHSEPFL